MTDEYSGSVDVGADFAADSMEELASIISELHDEEGGLPPLTEASTILQDYMDAWVLWSQQGGQSGSHTYYEYLFQAVARRAVFITTNTQ
jgi:hypothetical protein|tara:strand:+ start:916 stop:1185 length:270 start_codon:yes stop_codon:yes gene_type:complete